MDMDIGKLKGQQGLQQGRKPGLYMGNPSQNKYGGVDTRSASGKSYVDTPHAASTAIVLRNPNLPPTEAEWKRSKKAPKWEDEMERWGWGEG